MCRLAVAACRLPPYSGRRAPCPCPLSTIMPPRTASKLFSAPRALVLSDTDDDGDRGAGDELDSRQPSSDDDPTTEEERGWRRVTRSGRLVDVKALLEAEKRGGLSANDQEDLEVARRPLNNPDEEIAPPFFVLEHDSPPGLSVALSAPPANGLPQSLGPAPWGSGTAWPEKLYGPNSRGTMWYKKPSGPYMKVGGGSARSGSARVRGSCLACPGLCADFDDCSARSASRGGIVVTSRSRPWAPAATRWITSAYAAS